jgi:maltose O-acetyltransferase
LIDKATVDVIKPGAYFRGKPAITNEGRILIGNRFRLSSVPVMAHLVTTPGAIIEIGDDVTIGHGSGLAASQRIVVESGTTIGAFVLIMDTDYHVAGNATAHASPSPIRIGRDVRIGNHVTVLRGAQLGHSSIVMDGAVVSGIIAPGEIVAGNPAMPIRASMQDSPLIDQASVSLSERLQSVAMKAFRLESVPDLSLRAGEVPAWDSLGMLSFILALEEEFGVVINEDDVSGISDLKGVATLIERKLN